MCMYMFIGMYIMYLSICINKIKELSDFILTEVIVFNSDFCILCMFT